MAEKQKILEKLTNSIIDYNKDSAVAAAKEAIEAKVDPLEAIEKGLALGMKEVGDRFSRYEYPLPFVILASEAMTAGVDYLTQFIAKDQIPAPLGTYVLGIAAGDIHEIGAKIIKAFLEISGFRVIYLGSDTSVDKFIETAEREKADIIGVSALMTNTMIQQKFLIETLKKRGLREKYKVMVGGAPVTGEWAEEIAADGFALDAAICLDRAKELLK